MDKPKIEDQKDLISIDKQKYDYVDIPRTDKKVKVGWMKPETLTRISELVLDSGFMSQDEEAAPTYDQIHKYSKFASKYVALILLNGFKINFLYGIYWRWLYYVKGYDYDQLMPIILIAKKKVPSAGLRIAIISAQQMNVTTMTMTKKEQELFQSALTSE